MAGRKSKLTPEVQTEIVNTLALGCTVRDACELAGIDESTYFRWCEKSEFCNVVTDAQARARRRAVSTITSALMPSTSHVKETVTFEETRLRTVKVKDKDGHVIGEEQQPYTYKRTTVSYKDIETPADWRAGVEYLKRRDNRHWSDKITVTIDDLRQQAINDIRAGVLTYDALAAEDKNLADELFIAAGVPIES